MNFKIDKTDEDNYKFTFETEDGKEIECEVLFSFYLKKQDKQYWIITDNTLNDDGNLNIYVYYNSSINQELIAVTDKEELDSINKIYTYLIDKVGEERWI